MSAENTSDGIEVELTLAEEIAKLDEAFEAESADPAESQTETTEEVVVEEDKLEANSEEEVVEEPIIEPVAEEPTPELTAYQPNLTYKVHDKEFTFDDKISGYIKSEEDESYFRDLFTKAAGVDVIKPKLEREREERATLQESYNSVEAKNSELASNWDYFQNLVETSGKGDSKSVNSLLDALNIPDHVMGQVLANRLEMTPEQRQTRTEVANTQYQNHVVQGQNEALKRQQEELEYKQADFELTQVLSSQGNADVASRIDEALGAGAFRNEVTELGIKLENEAINNKTAMPTYEQVIGLVSDKYSRLMGNAPSAPIANEAVSSPEPVAAQKVTKRIVTNNNNTLPNLGSGNGESPVGRAINSVEDIEAEYAAHMKGNRS